MKTRIFIDGAKNSVIALNGQGPGGILLWNSLGGKPSKVKLQGVLYSFEKDGDLYWLFSKEQELFLPLAGRGKLNFEEFHSLPCPDTCTGINLVCNGSFFIMLDLEKV